MRKDLFPSAKQSIQEQLMEEEAKTTKPNEAGGKGYAFKAEHALAQYAVTGTFNTTYSKPEEQMDKLLETLNECSAEFIAKTAVYARTKGFMKDVPAFLAAYLAHRDVKFLHLVFPKVIDNGKMLRNFVQIIRSGKVGRKSLGTAPKKLIQKWFNERTVDQIFRQSIGNNPSMGDVLRLSHPSPGDDQGRAALYRWLIGKEQPEGTELPGILQEFEDFKSGKQTNIPNVPFEMLTALPLTQEHWKQIALRMSWTQLRMNLNSLEKHGAFNDPNIVNYVGAELSNPHAVRKSRVFPYQLMMAYKASIGSAPMAITIALQQAMEIAIENVPTVRSNRIYICPDVSGSMNAPVTGNRWGATSAVNCIDVAALVAAAFLRKNPLSEVIPFSDDVVPLPKKLNPLDSIMTNAEILAGLPAGGTACSAPLRHLNTRKAEGDLIVYVSDNMSWRDFKDTWRSNITPMRREWAEFQKRNPKAQLVLLDIQPYDTTQVSDSPSVLNIGGFSDNVFEVISLFSRGELGADHWVGEINKISLA